VNPVRHYKRLQAVIDAKKLRTITGYTHQAQSTDAGLWLKKAVAFHEAAKILHQAGDRLTDKIAIVSFNYALSLELIMKAIMVAEGRKPNPSHELNKLCAEAHVEVDDSQKATLDLLTTITLWRGRYPVPNKEDSWNEYHDNVLEKHKVNRKLGNVYSTSVNAKTWPTEENYLKIWNACHRKFADIKVKSGNEPYSI
jgi:hypothetical protein